MAKPAKKRTRRKQRPAKKPGYKGRPEPVAPELWPEALIAYVDAGNPIRNLPDDPLAGRCGAEKQRIGNNTPYCERGAGHNTDHLGIGRCKIHENDYTSGLAPWVGEISAEQWSTITGARSAPGGIVGFSADELQHHGLKPFDAILCKRLDPDDLEAYLSAPLDAGDVINANLRERWMAKDRIYRHLQKVRVTAQQRVAELYAEAAAEPSIEKKKALLQEAHHVDRVAAAARIEIEPTLNRITAVFARLLEVAARFQELQSNRQTNDAINNILAGLTDDQFARVKADPLALARLMSTRHSAGIPAPTSIEEF